TSQPLGQVIRFCIPNADTSKTFGVFDVNNVQYGSSLIDVLNDDGSKSNVFTYTFPTNPPGNILTFFVKIPPTQLFVIVEDIEKKQCCPDPPFIIKFQGFINGDTASIVTFGT